MAYCVKCGTQISEQAPFCSQCGAQQKSVGTLPAAMSGGAPTSALSENVAGFLCYLFFWVSGVIFLLIDKRPFVRFHAAQSIVIFVGLHVVHLMMGIFWGFRFFHGGWAAFAPGLVLYRLVDLVGLVLWVFLMIKAYQGEWFKVPVVWEIAEGLGGKVPADHR